MNAVYPFQKSPRCSATEANQTAVHGSRRDRLDRLPLRRGDLV